MVEENLREQILDQLIHLLGDEKIRRKIAGSFADKREIVSPLLDIDSSALSNDRPQMIEIEFDKYAGHPSTLLALWRGLENSKADDIDLLLDQPILHVEIILSSADTFTKRINEGLLPEQNTIIIAEPGMDKLECSHCGIEVNDMDSICSNCGFQLHLFKKLPIVEGGVFRTSYNMVSRILKWPEVISLNNSKKYYPT